jgi:hypothetical protein
MLESQFVLTSALGWKRNEIDDVRRARLLDSRTVRTPRKSVSQLGITLSASKKRSSSPLRLEKDINRVMILKQYMGMAFVSEISDRTGGAREVAIVWRAVASAE